MSSLAQPKNGSTHSVSLGGPLSTTSHVEEPDPYLVLWAPDDPSNPYSWSNSRKAFVCFILLLQMFWVTSISSIYAPAAHAIAEEFSAGEIVSKLPLAMYLLGFAFGPVLLTPLAEDYGRKPVFSVCLVLLYIFQIPCALAQNIETIIICRFIGGFVASPVFNACANIPDMWRDQDTWGRWALNFWALTAESIILGPIIGAYVTRAYGWRWVFWVCLIVGCALAVPFLLFVPETREGPLLAHKAKKLRKETGDSHYYAEQELIGKRSMREVLRETLSRPLVMLFTEPIVFLFGLWDGLNYGIVYLAIESVPLIFEQFGFHDPEVNLIFIAAEIGFILALPLYGVQMWLERRVERTKGVAPESKLMWGWFGGILFPVSLYWYAWTTRTPFHWLVPSAALTAFSISSHVLFLLVSDYTVDSYGHLASSAVTGQSFLREILSAVLSIVAVPFYRHVGFQWASCILAIIVTPMACLPFLFYWYGPTIRKRSRFAQMLAELDRKHRAREAALALRTVPKAQP